MTHKPATPNELRELLRDVYLFGAFAADNACVDDEAYIKSSNCADIVAQIIESLSPRPLDDGELEREYRDAYERLHFIPEYQMATKAVMETLTALHTAYERKQQEVERLSEQLNGRELSLKQTDEWVDILFRELTETVKGGQMTKDEKESYQNSLMRKYRYGESTK